MAHTTTTTTILHAPNSLHNVGKLIIQLSQNFHKKNYLRIRYSFIFQIKKRLITQVFLKVPGKGLINGDSQTLIMRTVRDDTDKAVLHHNTNTTPFTTTGTTYDAKTNF